MDMALDIYDFSGASDEVDVVGEGRGYSWLEGVELPARVIAFIREERGRSYRLGYIVVDYKFSKARLVLLVVLEVVIERS